MYELHCCIARTQSRTPSASCGMLIRASEHARPPACMQLQLDVRLARRDPRWHCERTFRLTLAGGQVDIFFIDTTPLLAEYEDVPWRDNRGTPARALPLPACLPACLLACLPARLPACTL